MLGSAAQNIIVLSDNVFLYHVSKTDFAAVGLVGVFYLIIASIGYGFSRGGQILIARRHGEDDYVAAGNYFKALVLFEFGLAVLMFCFLMFGSAWFFSLFVENQVIYEKCLEYIYPRSYGIFFSYIGVSFVAFYTGIARTRIIVYDTFILIIVNIILNYIFIFGAFGIEPMGIAGAGWASTLAEVVAFLAFFVYLIFDKANKVYGITTAAKIKLSKVVQTFDVSAPIVWQSIIGLGSWFIFFTLIENMGSRELEISNLIRNIYLILSIPCWGYSAGISTLVSNFIGNRKRQAIVPIIWKTAKMSLINTLIFALPVAVFPKFFLYPLFGSNDTAHQLFIDVDNNQVYSAKIDSLITEVPIELKKKDGSIKTIFPDQFGNYEIGNAVAVPNVLADDIEMKSDMLPIKVIVSEDILFIDIDKNETFEKDIDGKIEYMSLINDAKPLMPILILILCIFAIGSIFINGLTGTGHTKTALWIQSIFVVFYVAYSFVVIKKMDLGLSWAWAVEIFYWIGIWAVCYWYLLSNKWHQRRF
jgi:putative MATE family efflux protein